MNRLQMILEAYRNGERDLPGYAELMEIAQVATQAGKAEPRVEFYTEAPIQSHSMSIAEAARVLAGFFNEFPGGLEEMQASQPMSREGMSHE